MQAPEEFPAIAPTLNRGGPRGVAVVDAHMRIRYADAAALSLLGLADGDSQHPHLLAAVHRNYRAYVTSEILLAISSAKDTLARSVMRADDSDEVLEFQFHKLAGEEEAVLATVSVAATGAPEKESLRSC